MKKSKKILIVEDNNLTLGALVDKFTREGLKVIHAQNGKEALKLAQERNPDLILLDIVLPELSGIDVIKHLCKNDRTKNIPVVVLSNISDVGKVTKDIDGKISNYLVKSNWTINSVVRIVKRELKK